MEAIFCDTNSHDEFLAGQGRLTALCTSGQLTRELLDQAMRAMYDDGDYIDQSIGFAWLVTHPDLFGQAAEGCGFKVSAFLLEHSKLCWVGCRTILYPDVLKLIPAEEREEFVRAIYRRQGAFNNTWIQAVTSVGVPLPAVAEMILEALEAVADDCEKSNVTNAVWDFLGNHGSTYAGDIHWSMLTDERFSELMTKFAAREPARFLAQRGCIEGRLGTARYEELAALAKPRSHEAAPSYPWGWEPTQWTVLGDAQFGRAITICARKSPNHFFEKRRQIEERLGQAGFKTLALVAVLRLSRLTPAQQNFVEEQPRTFQLQVAYNLDTNALFLLGVILKLSGTDGEELYSAQSKVLDAEGIAHVYRTTWAMRHNHGKPIAPWLERDLERRLAKAGYIIATVQEGSFTPRGGRPQAQMQVVHNGHTYVKERRQGGYYPRRGDPVIINTRGGQPLTPKVTAVLFLPARSGEEVKSY